MSNSVPKTHDALFEDACSQPIAALARMGSLCEFERKSLVIKEGDRGQTLFVLLSGRVRIYSQDMDGRRFLIGVYGPGTLFGEGSMDGGPRTASVAAMTDLVCSAVPYAAVKAGMANDPAFAMTLLMELVVRSRATAKRMKSLALESVYQRLRTLVDSESTEKNGARVLGPNWSQQEIADRLGASRDMVTRIFRELSRGGYIEIGRGTTKILRSLPKVW
ncbi:MAG: Crp/Fnr family transcriptional regulator [Proteobacteria bacterium]|nr:Crp/Fnr family transcriptional regulator [Pseudomonadota bacterium]